MLDGISEQVREKSRDDVSPVPSEVASEGPVAASDGSMAVLGTVKSEEEV
jgi:hypothetical protein